MKSFAVFAMLLLAQIETAVIQTKSNGAIAVSHGTRYRVKKTDGTSVGGVAEWASQDYIRFRSEAGELGQLIRASEIDDIDVENEPPPTPTPAPLTIAEQAAAAVEVKYDRFKDEVKVGTDWTAVSDECDLKFNVFAVSKGKTPKQPAIVMFGLHERNDEWEYLKSHSLDFLVDGRPVAVGETRHDGEVGSGHVDEFMWALIPRDMFAKIAAGKVVELRLFTTECPVSPDELLVWKEFAKQAKVGPAVKPTPKARRSAPPQSPETP